MNAVQAGHLVAPELRVPGTDVMRQPLAYRLRGGT